MIRKLPESLKGLEKYIDDRIINEKKFNVIHGTFGLFRKMVDDIYSLQNILNKQLEKNQIEKMIKISESIVDIKGQFDEIIKTNQE